MITIQSNSNNLIIVVHEIYDVNQHTNKVCHSMNDDFNRANIGDLAGFAGSLGRKGTVMRILVIIIGVKIDSIF